MVSENLAGDAAAWRYAAVVLGGLYAVAVAGSRVHLGDHYLLDMLGGMLCALAAGLWSPAWPRGDRRCRAAGVAPSGRVLSSTPGYGPGPSMSSFVRMAGRP